MSETLTLSSLSKEERAQLIAEARKEEAAEKEKRTEDRKAYKKLVHETVPDIFSVLAHQSESLAEVKKKIFLAAEDLINLKKEAYEVKEGQQSHTFTSEDGDLSFTIGYRVIDGWDDTVPTGISKVNEFLESLIKDEDSIKVKRLANTINRLLKKDSNGNLKSSRVLELQEVADEWNDELLNDGVDIIRKGYQPQKSCWFIEAYYVDGTGKKKNVPLSISTVDFPAGTEINFM